MLSWTQLNAILMPLQGFILKVLIFCVGGLILTEKAAFNSNFGKKRKINRDSWIDNERKRLKQNGLEHKDRNGKNHEKVKDPSLGKCCKRVGCELEGCKMSDEEKLRIHLNFWPGKKEIPEFKPDNYNAQQSFIQGNLNWDKPKQQIAEQSNKGHVTWSYTLPTSNGRKLKVCSTTFENVLQISGGRLSYIQNRIKNGDLTIIDLRGTHCNNPFAISDAGKQIVKDHFLSFPRCMSHYYRRDENPLKEFLDPELTQEEMYRQYVEMMTINECTEIVSKTVYKNMFAESGLQIGSPRTDVCDVCTKLDAKIKATDSTNAKLLEELTQELHAHQEDAQLAYDELENDTILAAAFPEDYFTICIDMEQIMSSPKLDCSEDFYTSKFNSYNCGVTNTLDDTTTMYFYNSTEGKKGEGEISSILHHYIVNNFTLLKEGQQRVLNIFSDRCTGQNNNYLNVTLYKYIISLGYFTEIHQKFLFTGHSFLPCDRAFAMVEKAASKKKIYSPLDWIEIIKTARLKKPFIVVELKFSDFLDFDKLRDLIPIPNSLQVTKCKWISMNSLSPHIYKTKPNFRPTTEFDVHVITEPFTRKRIVNRQHWTNDHLINFIPNRLRSEAIKPSLHLISCLKKLVQFIPIEKRAFFDTLITSCAEPATQ